MRRNWRKGDRRDGRRKLPFGTNESEKVGDRVDVAADESEGCGGDEVGAKRGCVDPVFVDVKCDEIADEVTGVSTIGAKGFHDERDGLGRVLFGKGAVFSKFGLFTGSGSGKAGGAGCDTEGSGSRTSDGHIEQFVTERVGTKDCCVWDFCFMQVDVRCVAFRFDLDVSDLTDKWSDGTEDAVVCGDPMTDSGFSVESLAE